MPSVQNRPDIGADHADVRVQTLAFQSRDDFIADKRTNILSIADLLRVWPCSVEGIAELHVFLSLKARQITGVQVHSPKCEAVLAEDLRCLKQTDREAVDVGKIGALLPEDLSADKTLHRRRNKVKVLPDLVPGPVQTRKIFYGPVFHNAFTNAVQSSGVQLFYQGAVPDNSFFETGVESRQFFSGNMKPLHEFCFFQRSKRYADPENVPVPFFTVDAEVCPVDGTVIGVLELVCICAKQFQIIVRRVVHVISVSFLLVSSSIAARMAS